MPQPTPASASPTAASNLAPTSTAASAQAATQPRTAADLAARPAVTVTGTAVQLVREMLATTANNSTDQYLDAWMARLGQAPADDVIATAGSLRALVAEMRARALGNGPLAQQLNDPDDPRMRSAFERVEGVIGAIETRTGTAADPSPFADDARWLFDRLTPRAVARALIDPRGFDKAPLPPVLNTDQFPGVLAGADVRDRKTLSQATERLLITARDDPRQISSGMVMALTVTQQIMLNRGDPTALAQAQRVVAIDPRPAATAARLRQFANLVEAKQREAGTQALALGAYDVNTLTEHLRGVAEQIDQILGHDYQRTQARSWNLFATPANGLIDEAALRGVERAVIEAVQGARPGQATGRPPRPSVTHRSLFTPAPQAESTAESSTPGTPAQPAPGTAAPASAPTPGASRVRGTAAPASAPAPGASRVRGTAAPASAPAPGASRVRGTAAPGGADPSAAAPAHPVPAQAPDPTAPAPPARLTTPASGPVEPRSTTPDLTVDPEVAAEYALLGSLLHAPGVLSHLETFLEAANFAHEDTRAVYRTLLGLHHDGMLHDVVSLPEQERTDAANENHVKLITALRGQAYAEHVVANPARVIARMNAAAPTSALPYKGVYEPAAQVELGGKVLEAAFVREARKLHLELKPDRPLLSIRKPTEEDVRDQLETLEELAANVEDMAARLTEATLRAGRQVQPVDSTPAAEAADRATRPGWVARKTEGLREQLNPVLRPFQHRAERLLLHLVLHAGRLDQVPRAVLDLDPEQFSDRRHANVWRTVQDLRAAGKPVNYVAVMLEAEHNPDGHRPLPSLEYLTRMAAPPVDPETKEIDREKVASALRTVVNSALARMTSDTGKAVAAVTASDVPVAAKLDETAKAVDWLKERATTALRRHEQATAVNAVQGRASR
ncbi:hypothetical protein ALI22I_20230 [Saccharothrix sp. ALI-22-I]|nr:hypothetical protein ALI22I_20230 [Saccharothrix sp. ALI-22-I]